MKLEEKFLDWASVKFGSLEKKGDEICVNSIFTTDQKKKLWCNPRGGKNKIKYGVFHCWKSGKKGTLVSLVMEVEKCSKQKAMEILGFEKESVVAPEEINFDFDFGPQINLFAYEDNQKVLSMPPFTFPINTAPSVYYERSRKYLSSRKIPVTDFFVCTGGKYENRIVIPYYNSKKQLIYFNSRALDNNPLRYRGPEKEIGVGKEDVIYFPAVPDAGSTVYLCEGEFDAYSLYLCGLNSAACGGKNLSDKQAIILSPYKIVFAFDADDAGQSSLPIIKNRIMQYGSFPDCQFVSPPYELKDWNNFYCKFDETIVKAYVHANTKEVE